MAFDAGKFNARSSINARSKNQQYWTHDAGSDLLATVVAADYFLTATRRPAVGDIIQTSTLGGGYELKVLTSTSTGLTVEMANSVQALAGPGAADTISRITELTTSSTDAITLIDGAVGQIKTIILLVDGGTPTLTPTTLHGATTVVFADAGDSVTLLMGSLGWTVIAQGGLAGGPVVG